jgi:hypothetical protein
MGLKPAMLHGGQVRDARLSARPYQVLSEQGCSAHSTTMPLRSKQASYWSPMPRILFGHGAGYVYSHRWDYEYPIAWSCACTDALYCGQRLSTAAPMTSVMSLTVSPH